MNRLQVYHPAPRNDGVDKDVCIPKLTLRACERGNIGSVDKKKGLKKSRSGYAPTKDDVKDDNKMTTRPWTTHIRTPRLPVGRRGI